MKYFKKSTNKKETQYVFKLHPDKYNKYLIFLILSTIGLFIIYPQNDNKQINVNAK